MKRFIIFLTAIVCMLLSVVLACCGEEEAKEDPETCAHEYGAWEITTPPTCSKEGEQVKKCQKCGKEERETLQKVDHDYEEKLIKAPTCEEDGVMQYICKFDPSHTYTEPVNKLGHDVVDGEGESKAPTCTEPGFSASGFCRRCKKTVENAEIPALGHLMSEMTVVKEPTCEEEGLKESHCLREGCSEKKEEKLQKLEHRFTDIVTRQADCTHTGEKSRTCTRPECGKTTVEEIPALGHDWNAETPSKAPTCTEKGLSPSGTCRRCGITQENVELPALGHDFYYTDESEYATCLTPGKNVKRCSRCNAKEEEIVPALGHDLSAVIIREPTCQSTGTKDTFCRRRNCDYDVTETMPKVDHDFTITHWIVKPTCTEPGKKKMSCRFSCWTETDPIDVPATGHDWQEVEILQAATCQADGKIERTCLTCKTTEEYKLDKVDHKYGDFIVDTPATASSNGTKSKHCIYCGKKSEVTSIPKISGNEIEYEVQLRRINGMDFSPKTDKNHENVKYEFYKDSQLLKTVDATKDITLCKIQKDANKLKVTGLPKGYTSVQSEYTLSAGSPIVTVEVKGGFLGEKSVENDKNVTKKPDPLLEVGDFMYDLYIYNTKDHTKDGWLSDIIKDKKLVFLDFFHVHCGWCTIHMKQFILAYERTLHKYKDDMLVLMLDVMDYEDDEDINIYRSNEHIPEDFVSASCNFESVNVTRWFKNYVPTPGHIWLDNEGMIFYYKVTETQEDFTKFVEDYFARFRENETERKTLQKDIQTVSVLEKKEADAGEKPHKIDLIGSSSWDKRRLFAQK